MARPRLCPGEKTASQEFKLTMTQKRLFKANTKAEGGPSVVLRDLVEAYNKRKGKTATAKRAAKGGKKSFPIRMAASKKKKRR